MKEVIDRQPLNNRKNNICRFNIPDGISSVAQLIALLKNGIYGDIFSNNATDNNAGAAVQGTPVNKALFDSIIEGALDMSTVIGVQCMQRTKHTAGWQDLLYDTPLLGPPLIFGVCSGAYHVEFAAINENSCAYRVLNSSGSTLSLDATIIFYILDLGGREV